MKVIKIVLFLVAVAIAGVGWKLTMSRLDQLERTIATIEARPLTLQDDTKRCLEDLCRKVAGESASETHNAMSDNVKASCDQLAQRMLGAQQVLGHLADAVSNDWNKACREMLSDGKDCLRLAKDESTKIYGVVREDSQKCVQATEKILSQLDQRVLGAQQVLGQLADVVSNDWNKACREMLSDGKGCLRLAKDESTKICEEVREDSQKSLQATEKMISKIADQMKHKSDDYLAAARKNTNDYRVCELLYRAAILFAEDKKPLLSEYAALCRRSVKDLVERGRVDEARRRSTSLVEFFDGIIGTGSVTDIRSIPELTNQLAAVKNLVDAAQSRADDDRIAILKEVEETVRSATNYAQCVECRKKLADLDLPADMMDRKDLVDQQISTKMSILSPATVPLSLPPVGEDTPWIAWLENYKMRLSSDDLTDEARAGEFATVGEFLAAAKDVDDAKVRTAVAEVEKLGAVICRNVWRKKVLDATSKAKDSRDDMQKCVEMLAASLEFSEDEKELCRDEIIALNRVVVTASLRELRQQAESAKALKAKLSSDEYQQLLSMIQGQCYQILLRLQSLNQQFKGSFDSDIDRVSVAISGFSSVMTGFRKDREASDVKNQKECDAQFRNWVNERIDLAEEFYNLGENKAKEWFATTSNDEAQSNYRLAWEVIMEVNSVDLGFDPALERRWSQEKEKIEKRYTPTDEDLKDRTYRGRDSFR